MMFLHNLNWYLRMSEEYATFMYGTWSEFDWILFKSKPHLRVKELSFDIDAITCGTDT